jgi:hypothetical protein
MEVLVGATKFDQGTEHLAALIRSHLEELSTALSGEYGGPMDHLWIELELSPGNADVRPAFPFRFQKRVRTPRELRAFGEREFFNVGNYSVRPDYCELARVPLDDVPCYLMSLLYESTECLRGKRQLKGFDVESFRERFAHALAARGRMSTA